MLEINPSNFSVNRILQKLTRPLMKNRFVARIIGPVGADFDFDYLYIKSVSIPATDITQQDLDWSGHTVGVPNKYVPNELMLTIINYQSEYYRFKQFINKFVYNQDKHIFGYFNDIRTTIEVTEYYFNGDPAWAMLFEKCIIRGLSQIDLEWEAEGNIETFTATFMVGKDTALTAEQINPNKYVLPTGNLLSTNIHAATDINKAKGTVL